VHPTASPDRGTPAVSASVTMPLRDQSVASILLENQVTS
jgi:hypothetical protein